MRISERYVGGFPESLSWPSTGLEQLRFAPQVLLLLPTHQQAASEGRGCLGRRTSGSSKPSLGVQALAVFFFISDGKSQFEKCLGEHPEVPDILLPDIRGLLTACCLPEASVLLNDRRLSLHHIRSGW